MPPALELEDSDFHDDFSDAMSIDEKPDDNVADLEDQFDREEGRLIILCKKIEIAKAQAKLNHLKYAARDLDQQMFVARTDIDQQRSRLDSLKYVLDTERDQFKVLRDQVSDELTAAKRSGNLERNVAALRADQDVSNRMSVLIGKDIQAVQANIALQRCKEKFKALEQEQQAIGNMEQELKLTRAKYSIEEQK